MSDKLETIARDGLPGPRDLDVALDAIDAVFLAPEAAPTEPQPLVLGPLHLKLLERGSRARWIGISDDMGLRMAEVSVLGELRRAGLVTPTNAALPPGPKGVPPHEITLAGRDALAAATAEAERARA